MASVETARRSPNDRWRRTERPPTRLKRRRIAVALVALVALVVAVVSFRDDDTPTTASRPSGDVTTACSPGSRPDEPGAPDQDRPSADDYPAEMAFDPGSGRMVLVPWSLGSGTAWTFDVCTNTFARLPLPLPQGSTEGPRELVQSGTPGVMVGFWLDGAVWTLDAGASRWDEAGGWTTALDPQAVYRQASDLVSMLFSDGMAAVYDAAETSWRTLLGDPTGRRLGTGPLHRLGFAMAYDPVNERFVITGGQFRRKSTTWVVAVDVWAIDGAGGEPLELVPQSRSAPARAGT